MRTLVGLTDRQVAALDELSKREERSRAALIRQAIDDYLAKQHGRVADSTSFPAPTITSIQVMMLIAFGG